MTNPTDTFHDSTNDEVRSLLNNYYPNRGVRRMKRTQLIDFLVQILLQEEADCLARLARRQVEASDGWHPAHVIKTTSHLQARYSHKIVRGYRASEARRSHQTLPTVLESEMTAPRPVSLGCESGTSGVPVENMTEQHQPEEVEDVDWPQPVPEFWQKECLSQFKDGTNLRVGATCSVCARRSWNKDVFYTGKTVKCHRIRTADVILDCLKITDQHVLERNSPEFHFQTETLRGLALCKAGVHEEGDVTELDICEECHRSLTATPQRIPALSLKNNNIRGTLPAHLQDLTWLEERLCALYLCSAHIVRLYDLAAPGAPEHRSRAMKGHTCAFPLNTMATATKLPWAFGDGGPEIACLWIGPRKPRPSDLKYVFNVRRQKVADFLQYLRANFKGFPQFVIDSDQLNSLPEDDVPELIMRYVVHSQCNDVPSLFEAETAGLEQHPALQAFMDDERPRTFLEHHGIIDIDGVRVPGTERTANALQNDFRANFGRQVEPDLIVRRGNTFVRDYNNPQLFPGMFPTLFPWGIGGFEADREVPLSFARQAQYLLDIADPAFRRHWSFIFAVANIKQRRAIHLGSRLACKSKDFPRISSAIRSLSSNTVNAIAEHIQAGGSLNTLTSAERKIFTLLKKCELLSVKVPGSKAVMNKARADIRAMTGKFGIFQLFLTLNPTAAHSPAFHLIYGDTEIDLNVRTPRLPTPSARASRVADDPVAASDFFHFHVHAIFKYLFGWDHELGQSTPEGGILGPMAAFFLVKEHNMRGQLHGHAVIWLKGGVNPGPLRQRLYDDEAYRDRYLSFFDQLIAHEAPPKPEPLPDDALPVRTRLCPDPRQPGWKSTFDLDHYALGEEVQRHRHTFTCFKGGRSSCRFLFPHDRQEQPAFDPALRAVLPRARDPTMNWHNPLLLVATRHNHDLKSVQSGKSSAAAASYITSYATKHEETPANQIKMINTVFQQMEKNNDSFVDVKALLTKCVMQFGRERQIHAQQAATYVRELDDTMQSHVTVPMLTGRLMLHIERTYGPFADSAIEPSSSVRNDQSRCTNNGTETDIVSTSTNVESVDNIEVIDIGDQQNEDSTGANEDLIALGSAGQVHQVHDYLHRGSSLANLNFYDFVEYCSLVRKPRKLKQNHHHVAAGHPKHQTHCHSYTPTRSRGIPRAIYNTFPRPDGTAGNGNPYCATMLAHFKPFNNTMPLKTDQQSYEEAFAETTFSKKATNIMSNWAALTECDDARDAELLQRRKAEACRTAQTEDFVLNVAEGEVHPDSATADVDAEALQLLQRRQQNSEIVAFAPILAKNGWFASPSSTAQDYVAQNSGPQHPALPSAEYRFIPSNNEKWLQQQTDVEARMRAEQAAPRALSGLLAEDLGIVDSSPMAEVGDTTLGQQHHIVEPSTTVRVAAAKPPEELISGLIKERRLTRSQSQAFTIVARHFFKELHGEAEAPLRLLMHGEAGTGKTVVVKLLRELLERFGKGNEILLMAPTGKAAAAIGGSTQHSTFLLDIHKRRLTTEEATMQQDRHAPKKMTKLQQKFRDVKWLFFDEISMTSAEVLCEIDQALRIGTTQTDIPFGGMNVIFAGDLCQLPPVAAATVYPSGSSSAKSADIRTKIELGRAAWQSITEVVEFSEQMRMQDKAMAATLSRLRIRECTSQDAALFNSRVLQSKVAPQGPSLQNKYDAIALAYTNEAVRALNHQKATTPSTAQCCISYACDSAVQPLTAEERASLLNYNGCPKTRVGLGRIPLYIGMPVVFRGGNVSVPLGVTNGAFATVVAWDIVTDQHGYNVPRGIVLRFGDAPAWKLPDFESNCLPIRPTKSTFNFQDPTTGNVRKVTRMQLPIQPGFAMTVHSAQGITSKTGVIVDLTRGGFETYVAASRATSPANLFLIRPITVGNLNTPALPQALKKELARLQHLAEQTTERQDQVLQLSKRQAPTVSANTADHDRKRKSVDDHAGIDEPATSMKRSRLDQVNDIVLNVGQTSL